MKVIVAGSDNVAELIHLASGVSQSKMLDDIEQVLFRDCEAFAIIINEYFNSKQIVSIPFAIHYESMRDQKNKLLSFKKATKPKHRIIEDVAMCNNADALLLIWDGKCKRCLSLLETAERKKLKIYKHLVSIGE